MQERCEERTDRQSSQEVQMGEGDQSVPRRDRRGDPPNRAQRQCYLSHSENVFLYFLPSPEHPHFLVLAVSLSLPDSVLLLRLQVATDQPNPSPHTFGHLTVVCAHTVPGSTQGPTGETGGNVSDGTLQLVTIH